MHSILLVYYYLISLIFPIFYLFLSFSSCSVWNSFFIERIIVFYLQPNRIANTGCAVLPTGTHTHICVNTLWNIFFLNSSSLITIRYIKLLLLLSFENIWLWYYNLLLYRVRFFCFYFIFVFDSCEIRSSRKLKLSCVCLFFFQNKKSSQLFYDDRSAFAKKHHARNSGSEMIIPDMQFPNESRRARSILFSNIILHILKIDVAL